MSYQLFTFKDIKISIECKITAPVTKEVVLCPLVITKYGSPTFSYTANIDYGDGFNQSIFFNQVNHSKFVFENHYLSAGNYSVQFSIPNLNIHLSLLILNITGKQLFFNYLFFIIILMLSL